MAGSLSAQLQSRSARLQHLGVRNFRRFHEAALAFDGRHVCLFGANGVGKTSLLEALSLLAPGRGLRGARFPQMTRQGSPQETGWEISVRLGGVEARPDLGIRLAGLPSAQGRMRRQIQIDGAQSDVGSLSDHVRLLWMTPAHDRVFAGSEGEKRRFLDRLTIAHRPNHGRAWRDYEAAMRERNALFERSRHPDSAWLDALELRMAQAGAVIACNRASALASLGSVMQARDHSRFPRADMTVHGSCSEALAHMEEIPAMAERMAADLGRNRGRDAAAGRALDGVHRTGVSVIHCEKSMSADLCSSGEQKALLASLVLAAARAFLGGEDGSLRLLLLDEAGARLDSERRDALCEELLSFDGQAFLTGTDREWFDSFGECAQMIEIGSESDFEQLTDNEQSMRVKA